MATRPYFQSSRGDGVLCTEKMCDFKYYTGFSLTQKHKSVESLHAAIREVEPEAKILEVSRRSKDPVGQALSAFNLRYTMKNGSRIPVENCFQSAKQFISGGPFLDLLHCTPAEAKTDTRLRTSGDLIAFKFEGIAWPLEPKSFFYDFLYMSALRDNREVLDYIAQFNTFTDIEFNPNKSINCQARSVAFCVSIYKAGQLEEYLSDKETFKKIYRNYRADPHITGGSEKAQTRTQIVRLKQTSLF